MNSNATASPKDEQDGYVRSVIKIQRAWRRYIDIQVFKYYKDLVSFHNEGDPALIMKYINPNEAKFIDSASGILIRFRLAGQQFPPTIYYKIFTHRPVQDICANAPRDYTRPWEKIKSAELVNNRDKKISFKNKPFEGWYQRVENNGWRPVSDKHLFQMNIDYYFGTDRNRPKTNFHHSKLKRRQDVELNKKKKKIEWMKKMYRNELFDSSDPALDEIRNSAKRIIDNLDENSLHKIEDWEVDELLEWTNTLDFDSYYDDWRRIGTTKCSDQ